MKINLLNDFVIEFGVNTEDRVLHDSNGIPLIYVVQLRKNGICIWNCHGPDKEVLWAFMGQIATAGYDSFEKEYQRQINSVKI